MVVEEREYHIRTGKIPDFWELYRSVGLPIQIRHIGPPIGFFAVEVGAITNFVHMWLYRSLSDREERRERLHRDEEWKRYVPRSQEFILSMNTRILTALDVPHEAGTILDPARFAWRNPGGS
jgi:hypothetical protein